MEIERKYLVKTLPDHLDQYESKKIAQGYLCTEPVVRIRRSNNDYYLTYKGDGAYGAGRIQSSSHQRVLRAPASEN